MCIIFLGYRRHPRYELVVAANRDEFYARPTAPMAFWDEPAKLLAGRDLVAGGTWLGVSRTGKFAAITNYRDPRHVVADAPSRGLLVSEFLSSDIAAQVYLEELRQRAQLYNGFSLLLADASGLFYFSNHGDSEVLAVQPGVHGLSNHLLDTNWPKVQRGRDTFAEILQRDSETIDEELFALLMDRSVASDEQLPDTGVGLELEQRLAPIFIESPSYGTRSSSLVFLRSGGSGRVMEKTHDPGLADTPPRRFTIE